jgi:colanic acid/amylovoran biosynthesis glycosyltransferase
MKIGLYTVRFPKTTETWAVNKFAGLIETGADVHVFSANGGGDWDRFPRLGPRERTRVHTAAPTVRTLCRVAATQPRAFVRYLCHNWRWRQLNGLGFSAGVLRRLAFVGHRLDVLHLELDTMAPGVADMKEYLGSKLVLSCRSTLQRTGRPETWPSGLHQLFDFADAYHVETTYTERNLRELGLPLSVPIVVIPSNIDSIQTFVPQARLARTETQPLHILSASRLEPEKGLEFAIEAIALLSQRGIDLRYRIVGDGRHRNAIELAIQQFGIADRVELFGSRPPDEMIDHYQWAHVLLHASTDEGVPNVPLEAQAMGLPVVITDSAGNPDAVESGVTGFVVATHDVEAMAGQLQFLAEQPDEADRMGRAARARMLNRPSTAEWVERYVAFYRDVAGINK